MKFPKLVILVAVLFFCGAWIAYEAVQAQVHPSGKGDGLRVMNSHEQVEKLVRDFLSGAAKNDTAAHERFWSDDVIYTTSTGIVRTKAEILKNVKEASPKDPKTTYDAEDMTIHDYGDFAVVSFRLVAHGEVEGKPPVRTFRNTGTVRKINGQWKVVAWQATKIEAAKTEPTKIDDRK